MPGKKKLLAFDIRKGSDVWSVDKHFAGWLSYSEAHDVLCAAHGAPGGAGSKRVSTWFAAFRGKDGGELWSKQVRGLGGKTPPMIRGDKVHSKGAAVQLLTGDLCTARHPISGNDTGWTYTGGGCADDVGSAQLVFFRGSSRHSGGFWDLERHTGEGYIAGIRPSCNNNVIPANGVLSVPNYAQTCGCPYPINGSAGFVHVPENEQWTRYMNKINPPIRHIGINFGAPGAYLAEDGTLCLRYPERHPNAIKGDKILAKVMALTPEHPKRFCRHLSNMLGDGPRQVGASGLTGLETIEVTVADKKAPSESPYTVRLYFAEPDALAPGQRVFRVTLQGKTVLENLDVFKEAGGSHRTMVKEFKAIKIKDVLKLTFESSGGKANLKPLLCGLEIKQE
jgi:hypothetical protein